MQIFTLICGFIGAWLLVAGPVYQAAIELRDEDFADERMRELGKNVTMPPRVSAWWWMLPPVKIYLEQQRRKAFHEDFKRLLSAEELEAMVSYMNKAAGWVYVAGGGFLLAVKETYELIEKLALPLWLFWILVVVLAVGCVLNTVYRIKSSQRMTVKETK